MPLLIVLGIGAIYAVVSLYNYCTKNRHAFTSEELDQMSRRMIGKSQKECREILREYRK